MKKILLIIISGILFSHLIAQEFLGFGIRMISRKMCTVQIDTVYSGSAADYSGLRKGDCLIKINNKKFNDFDKVTEFFQSQMDSKRFDFEILRNGKLKKITIDIPDDKVFIGLLLKKVPQGVLVEEVLPNSPAYSAGIKANSIITKINDKFAYSPRIISKEINRVGYGKNVKISLIDNDKPMNINVLLYYWKIPSEYKLQDESEFINDMKQIIYMIEGKK